MSKKFIVSIIAIIISTISFVDGVIEYREAHHKEPEPTWESQWDELLGALMTVESNNDPSKIGGCGDWGILQITPIAVAEVNRLSGLNYTHEDAFDIEKSKEMFYIMARHYCPEINYEKMARIWNGGPKGPQKSCTLGYWGKVQKELKKGSC